MWYACAFNRIVNFDYLKSIYICGSSEFEYLGNLDLKRFVVCGTDAGSDMPIIINSWDTYQEAEVEVIQLMRRANYKEFERNH